MTPDPPVDPRLPAAAFLDLAPPAGGLAGVQARLRARQLRRRVGGGLALAALALLVVLPALVDRAPRADTRWTADIAVARATDDGPTVEARGPVGVVEVARTDTIVMVRVLGRPTAGTEPTAADVPPPAPRPKASPAR